MFFTECSNKGGKEVIMENQFNVTICRFHTKAKNKLLIIGWFNQNDEERRNGQQTVLSVGGPAQELEGL